ncbi:MAG: efflux RND transporter periplasmic adaptor subunit [Reyranella sp.]|uniref:efflux RND transporter periplasmic adaptor subunit n=1 Tax=Reyranella sp. TaxID=1929291 RepID=UPI003D0BA821
MSDIEHSEGAASTGRTGIVLMGAVLALFAGTLGVGAWQHHAQRAETLASAEQRRAQLPRVRTATVQARTGDLVVTLPATTSAFAVANVFARASGYVETRAVDIGDRVKAGQVLATIVAPELDHQIAQAEATLAQLEAALRQAEANQTLASVTWRRDGPLVKEGWLPRQQGTVDVQTLRANDAAVGVARANVEAQRAQLKVLQQQKLYQRVAAPFDGVITQRNIDIGSLVQADAVTGTFMFTVQQSNVIRTQIYVPQDTAVGVVPGIDAVVHVPEFLQRPFAGKVTRIADALQPGTRTLLVEIDIANPDGALVPGTYCTVDIHIPRQLPSLLVPAGAVIFNQGGLQVAVVENGTARLRRIVIARDLGTEVEVRDGVKAGDSVILNPAVDLGDGDRVDANPAQARPT